MEKSGGHNFHQMINFGAAPMAQSDLAAHDMNCQGHGIPSLSLSCHETFSLSLVKRNQLDKSKLRDSLQNKVAGLDSSNEKKALLR